MLYSKHLRWGHTLSEVGAFIWRHLSTSQDGLTREEIVDAVLSEFDSERATVEEDVSEFLGLLEEREVVTARGDA